MFLKHKRYAYRVYLTRSFSKAAEQLFISQPALSALIKKEEESIGMPIFDRSTTPISLTAAGEYYIKSVEKIMMIEQQMQEYFSTLSQKQKGTVNIGSSTFFCAYILPSLIQKILHVYPNYEINLLEASAPDLKRCLEIGTMDFVLVPEAYSSDAFTSFSVGKEHLILAVPTSYAVNQKVAKYALSFIDVVNKKHLEPDAPIVPIHTFQQEPFLLLKRGHDLHNRSLDIFSKAGFTPNVLLYLDQMFTAYQIAKEQKALTFIRSELLDHVEANDRLLYYKIDDPLAVRDIYFSYKNNRTLSAACQNVLQIVQSSFNTLGFLSNQ